VKEALSRVRSPLHDVSRCCCYCYFWICAIHAWHRTSLSANKRGKNSQEEESGKEKKKAPIQIPQLCEANVQTRQSRTEKMSAFASVCVCVCVCLFDCLIVFSESGGQSGGADLQEQNNKTKRCDSCSSSCGTGGCNPWHHVFLCFFLLLPFFFYKRSAAYGTVGASFGSLSFFKLLLFYRYLGCSSHMTRLPHGRF
jgi:hypothetical protein